MPFTAVVVAGVVSALAAPSAWRVRPRAAIRADPGSEPSGTARPSAAKVLAVGLAGAGVGALVTLHGWTAASPALLVATLAGLWLAIVDLRVHRLPAAQVYAVTVATVVLLATSVTVSGGPGRLGAAAGGAAALWAVYRVAAFGGGMARGDVRLAGLLGVVGGWHGWAGWYLAALVPFLVHASVGGVLWAGGWRRSGQPLPFGPAMLVGMLAAVTFVS